MKINMYLINNIYISYVLNKKFFIFINYYKHYHINITLNIDNNHKIKNIV